MTTSKPIIRLAILDDHPMIRRSIEIFAANSDDIRVAAAFGHSRELLAWLAKEECDVLILDYILQSDEPDSLSLIKDLLIKYPHLNILLASSMETLAVIRISLMLGVKGYIAKREEVAEYIQAIRTVASGLRYLPAKIAAELAQVPMRKRDKLLLSNDQLNISSLTSLMTSREAEVIKCFLAGMSLVEIAAELKLSRKTISGHKQSGMHKLGLTSDLELFKYCNDLFKQ